MKMMFLGLDLEIEGLGEKFVGEVGEFSMSFKGEDLVFWILFVESGSWRGSCLLLFSFFWREVRVEG